MRDSLKRDDLCVVIIRQVLCIRNSNCTYRLNYTVSSDRKMKDKFKKIIAKDGKLFQIKVLIFFNKAPFRFFGSSLLLYFCND